jgi:superfamily II DNA or RNA helicase
MAHVSDTLQWYIDYTAPMPPQFKGMDLDELRGYVKYITGYKYKAVGVQPRRNQLEGLVFALWQRRCLLFFDMRTGKTKIALDWLRYLKAADLCKKALIIAHSPVGIGVWYEQSKEHSKLNLEAIYAGPDAEQRLANAVNDPLIHGIITTWSVIQAIFAKKQRVIVKDKEQNKLLPDKQKIEIYAKSFTSLVIDEIHRTGNHTTLSFSLVDYLGRHCENRLGLTGTPFGRDPFKLWGEYYLIDGGECLGNNFYRFRYAFGTMTENLYKKPRIEWKFNKKMMTDLRRKIAPRMLEYSLSEIQDTPVIRNVVRLPMLEEQKRHYTALITKLIDMRKDVPDAEIEAIFIRLRQISSGYVVFEDESGTKKTVDIDDNAKLAWLENFLDEWDGTTSCVIFHEFIRTGQHIQAALTKRSIGHAWLYGAVSTAKRDAAIRDFQNKKLPILVCNTVGGIGINLSAADYMLFYESPVSVTARKQAEARPMARGDRPLVVEDLVCSPVEQKIIDFMSEGGNLMRSLIRKPKQLKV